MVGILGGAFGYHIGMRGPQGADNVFFDRAKKAKKRLAYLETVADTQYLLYPSASLEIELEILIQTLDRMRFDQRADERLINAWNAGDFEVIAAFEALEYDGLGAAAQAFLRGWNRELLHDRNARWVPQIEAMLKGSGTYFIAVGAAHMAGPDSVVKMLPCPQPCRRRAKPRAPGLHAGPSALLSRFGPSPVDGGPADPA